MKHAIYAVKNFLDDCKVWRHGKLNLMIHFIAEELPLIYEEMVKGQQEIEQLKERIRELEGDQQ